MKIQMRPIREELDSFVSGFAYGFKEIDRYSVSPIDLCRDAEFHRGIVQGEASRTLECYDGYHVSARFVPGLAGFAAVQ